NSHYLVVLLHSKRADLRAVADQIGDGKLSFGSPERLMTHLGLTPGSVSPFGLINDAGHSVYVVLDRDLESSARVSFHPNINTRTYVISTADFLRFLDAMGNVVRYVMFETRRPPLSRPAGRLASSGGEMSRGTQQPDPQLVTDDWVSFPGGELEGKRPKALCPACREAMDRGIAPSS